MDAPDKNNNNVFNNNSNICQQLLQRYSKSSAPQHHHLCAIAAATRSIIQSESLPITPYSYFAATVSTISILKIFLTHKAYLLYLHFCLLFFLYESGLGTCTVRDFVKCSGILVGFFGFEMLVKFSIDKRPKLVRRCSYDCILTVFKTFGSSSVAKKAGKIIHSLIKENAALAMELSAAKEISGSKDEHQEVLSIIPYLTVKDNEKAPLIEACGSIFSAFTRHIFDNIEAILDASGVEIILLEAEKIIKALTSYMLSAENSTDSVLFAATLAKSIIDKLHVWVTYFPLVVGSISGLLTRPENIALPASNILKELINGHIDGKKFLTCKKQAVDDEALSNSEFEAVKAICSLFANMRLSSSRYPNHHVLAILSVLFLKLGEVLDFCAKGVILKLSDWMIVASGGAYDTKSLQECIGSAIIAMGPEKLLALLPISLNKKDYSVSNSWLIPVLNKYICRSSLGFFMQHVVPLAASFEKSSLKVKKSVIREEFQAYARECWGLLPAFCRYPSDVHKNAQALTTLLIPFLKEDSFMLESISSALQELVNKNKNVLASDDFPVERIVHQTENENIDLASDKNIKALASCSEDWLQVLINVFFESSPANYQQFKVCILLDVHCDSSVTQKIFTSSMERAEITNNIGEYMKLGRHSTDDKENNSTFLGEVAKRCMILELGLCFVEGSGEDLIKVLFFIGRDVLEKHSWFRSSHVEQLINLLASVKPPTDTKSLTSRFACYKTLLVDAIRGTLDEENTDAFLILNEIILALKDSTEEGRKTAYDALISVCSSLRDSSSAKSNESHKKFVDMAVLGFVKVFVSSIQAKDLHNLLSDIVNGVLPWSSVSRHHFKSKVTVIVEILMRKCGVAAVKSVAAEKYENFLRTVSENRHGKSSSREDGTREMESTPSDSSQHKRKDRESSVSLKEKDSREPHKRKKRKENEKDSSTNYAKEAKRKNNTSDEPYFSSGSSAGRKPGKRKREFGHPKQEGDKGGKLKRGFPGKGKFDRQKRSANDI
ncbi:unnamed protein product [Withania somnifera]